MMLPVFGKSNTYFTCNFSTDVKDFAYVRQNGKLSSEPEARFKAWMAKHDYDPVHGKESPARLDASDAEEPTGTPAPQPQRGSARLLLELQDDLRPDRAA